MRAAEFLFCKRSILSVFKERSRKYGSGELPDVSNSETTDWVHSKTSTSTMFPSRLSNSLNSVFRVRSLTYRMTIWPAATVAETRNFETIELLSTSASAYSSVIGLRSAS